MRSIIFLFFDIILIVPHVNHRIISCDLYAPRLFGLGGYSRPKCFGMVGWVSAFFTVSL